jgi:hypothetical protein
MCQLFENEVWVEQNFGATDFGDKRLSSRLLKVTSRIAAHPEASLPEQMSTWGDLKGAYRLLSNSKVTHKRIQTPHREKVKRDASADGKKATVIFIQDGSEIDKSSHKATKGTGPIGNHTCLGMMIHSCLAVKYDATNPKIIGLAHQFVWEREHISLCRTETRGERNNRKGKESDFWLRTLRAIGSPPPGSKWVSVGDRGNDIYEFFTGAKKLKWELVVRASQNRAIEVDGNSTYLMEWAQSMPVMGTKVITIRKKGDTKPKQVTVNVAWRQIEIKPPQRLLGKQDNLSLCVIRCWNEEENIDWILYSTIAVNNLDEAIEKIEWYATRWTIEEYHKCLKTGCNVEASQLATSNALEAHFGILGIIALLMLLLRNASRDEGDKPASELVPEVALKIISKRYGRDKIPMTIHEFWRSVAKLGGFIGRKSDGDPGWQTLWRGWLRLLDMWWCANALESI